MQASEFLLINSCRICYFIIWFSFIALCVIALVQIWERLKHSYEFAIKGMIFHWNHLLFINTSLHVIHSRFSYGIPVIIVDHYKYVSVCVIQHWGADKIVSLYWFLRNSEERVCNKVIIKKYSKVYFNKTNCYTSGVFVLCSGWFRTFYRHHYFTATCILCNLYTGVTCSLVCHVYIIEICVWWWHIKYVFLNKCSVHM